MIKHRADSIQKLNDEQAAEAKKDKTIAEQADTIELPLYMPVLLCNMPILNYL